MRYTRPSCLGYSEYPDHLGPGAVVEPRVYPYCYNYYVCSP